MSHNLDYEHSYGDMSDTDKDRLGIAEMQFPGILFARSNYHSLNKVPHQQKQNTSLKLGLYGMISNRFNVTSQSNKCFFSTWRQENNRISRGVGSGQDF